MTQSTTKRRKTKGRLIEHAAKGLLETGTILGLGSFMASAGFTPGGFYKHFDSKEDLNVLAAECVLRGCAARAQSLLRETRNGATLALAIRAIIDSLVSTEDYTQFLLTPFGSMEQTFTNLVLYDAYANAVDLLMSLLETCVEEEASSPADKTPASSKLLH